MLLPANIYKLRSASIFANINLHYKRSWESHMWVLIDEHYQFRGSDLHIAYNTDWLMAGQTVANHRCRYYSVYIHGANHSVIIFSSSSTITQKASWMLFAEYFLTMVQDQQCNGLETREKMCVSRESVWCAVWNVETMTRRGLSTRPRVTRSVLEVSKLRPGWKRWRSGHCQRSVVCEMVAKNINLKRLLFSEKCQEFQNNFSRNKLNDITMT